MSFVRYLAKYIRLMCDAWSLFDFVLLFLWAISHHLTHHQTRIELDLHSTHTPFAVITTTTIRDASIVKSKKCTSQKKRNICAWNFVIATERYAWNTQHRECWFWFMSGSDIAMFFACVCKKKWGSSSCEFYVLAPRALWYIYIYICDGSTEMGCVRLVSDFNLDWYINMIQVFELEQN